MNLKERIRSGAPFHIGALAVDLPLDQMEKKCVGKGWDLAFVDLQHSPYTEPQLAEFCKRATALEVPLMLRAHHPSAAWQISRLLDFGAAGVLVPMVETPETVAEAVAAFYYPPLGKRSCGLRFAYGWSANQTPRAYADWWNANGILAVQIETVQAVLDVRRLVQPGVDLLLFGAVDLGFSLQASPGCPFKSVEECRQHVVNETRGLGVRVGLGDGPFGRF
ncbi:MAG: hypothetical protein FJ278_15410 [Planctomycetes bacterium]|nr:hypothetical protein [Planctomycetota bacterium]